MAYRGLTRIRAAVARALLAMLGLSVALFSARSATAQVAPPVTITLQAGSTPFAGFRDAAAPFGGAEQRTRFAAGSFSVPFVLGPRTFLGIDGNYRQTRLDGRGLPPAAGGADPILHDASLGVGVFHVLSPRWTILLRAGPSVASDFDEALSWGDVTIGGAVVFTRQFDRHWSGSFGAAYFTSLGIPFPVPVLGVSWTDGGRWRASATLPSSLEAWYRAGSAAEFGLRTRLDGGDHHVPGLFEGEEPRLRRIAVNVGPAARLSVGSGLTLDVGAGWGIEQIRLLDGDDELEGGEFDLEARPFARAALKLDL